MNVHYVNAFLNTQNLHQSLCFILYSMVAEATVKLDCDGKEKFEMTFAFTFDIQTSLIEYRIRWWFNGVAVSRNVETHFCKHILFISVSSLKIKTIITILHLFIAKPQLCACSYYLELEKQPCYILNHPSSNLISMTRGLDLQKGIVEIMGREMLPIQLRFKQYFMRKVTYSKWDGRKLKWF